MKKYLFQLSAIIGLTLLVSSCAKLPQEQLDAAKAAIESAKTMETNRYLADEFMALEDSLNVATVAIEAQKSKFFLSRDYKSVKENLVKITQEVETLKGRTEEQKAIVRAAVQDTLAVLVTLVEENKALILKAPKGKEGKEALEAIQNDITIIEATLNEISTLISNGDYLTAQDKTNASKEKALAIKDELTTAIQKSRRR